MSQPSNRPTAAEGLNAANIIDGRARPFVQQEKQHHQPSEHVIQSRMRKLMLAGIAIGLISQAHAMAETLKAGGAEIEVNFREVPVYPSKTVLLDLITKAAEAVSAYYARFPPPSALINVRPR